MVWDDSVAPETCIDFDAPHVENEDVIKSFLIAMGFFAGIYLTMTYLDPVANNPVVSRSKVINHKDLLGSLGIGNYLDGDGEEEEDED